MKWTKPDEEALKEFLVNQKGFQDVKVENGLKKLKATQGKSNQARLDCFFKAGPPKTSTPGAGAASKAKTALPNGKKSMPLGKK